MYQYLNTSLQNHILTITINRLPKMNALNEGVMDELNTVLDEIYLDANIRSAIITGLGEKAFVAGADIATFINLTAASANQLSTKGQNTFFRIENCPKPIVACVNGHALGGGCELAMSCHIRFAADNATFGQPETRLGLLPEFGGTQRLIQLIGKGRAMQLLLSGQPITAAKALDWGLVNEIVPPTDLLAYAQNWLYTLHQSTSAFALAACISASNAALDTLTDGYLIESEAFGQCFNTNDAKEGIAAFLEKRPPVFTGS